MNKKQKQFFGVNIGSASMLLIFVILCFVSFAALSIVSANADSRLSNKVAERTSSYYEACNGAEEALAELDRDLSSQYASSESEAAYFQAVGHDKSYSIPISESQALLVEIEILYPQNDSDVFYKILSWKVVSE